MSSYPASRLESSIVFWLLFSPLTAKQSKKGSGYATKNLNDWQPRPFGPRLPRSRKKTETAVIN